MNREHAKKIWKLAVLIYVASFLVINWSGVSWIFNYKEMSSLISDFFNPYPSIDAYAMDAYFYPNHSQEVPAVTQPVTPSEVVKKVTTSYTDKENTLEIPKISETIPIIFSTSTNIKLLEKDLSAGVAYYPGSVYPGQPGQIVILGHSAPIGWPNREKIGVFSNIDQLVAGDKIFIDLNNQQYTYIVKQRTIVKRGSDITASNLNANTNVLTLISCWPPGKDYQRIVVEAELISTQP